MSKLIQCVYDIKDNLKIANPSGRLRAYGQRLNLSCWVFPAGCVPTDILEDLRSKGADVHLFDLAEYEWDKVVALARVEIRKKSREVVDLVESRSGAAKAAIEYLTQTVNTAGDSPDFSAEAITDAMTRRYKHYRKWRAVIAKGRRELLAAEQCALGFGISRDVADALDALKGLLAAELDAALVCKDALAEGAKAATGEPAIAFQPQVA